MKKSIGSIVVLVVLMMSLGSVAYAQGPVPCGDLDAADCAILEGSQDAMLALSSAQTEEAMSMFIGGIPDAPFSELGIDIATNGQYSVDPDVRTEFLELSTLSIEEFASDLDEIAGLLLELYTVLNAEQNMTITLSDGVVDAIAEEGGMEMPATFGFGMIVADGVVYFDVSDFAFLSPDPEAMENWFAIDALEVLGISLEILINADADGSELPPEFQNFLVSLAMDDQEEMVQFVIVERLDDDQMGGEDVAVFQSTFDFNTFLASPEFREMVIEGMADADDMDMSPEEMDQMLSMVGLMAPMFTTDLTATSTQYIGLDTLYLHRNDVNFNWDLTPAMALVALADDTIELPDEAPVISFETSTVNSGFEEPIDILVPDNVIPIPSEVVFEGLAEMMN
ncbi:MAG: hypothetical protein AAF629_19360 [Chloroflexota bacterium]